MNEELQQVIALIEGLGESGLEAFAWYLLKETGLEALWWAFAVGTLVLLYKTVWKFLEPIPIQELVEAGQLQQAIGTNVYHSGTALLERLERLCRWARLWLQFGVSHDDTHAKQSSFAAICGHTPLTPRPPSRAYCVDCILKEDPRTVYAALQKYKETES